MTQPVDSSTRGVTEYLHFAAVFFGFICFMVGVITTTPVFTAFGWVIIGFGLTYFLLRG